MEWGAQGNQNMCSSPLVRAACCTSQFQHASLEERAGYLPLTWYDHRGAKCQLLVFQELIPDELVEYDTSNLPRRVLPLRPDLWVVAGIRQEKTGVSFQEEMRFICQAMLITKNHTTMVPSLGFEPC